MPVNYEIWYSLICFLGRIKHPVSHSNRNVGRTFTYRIRQCSWKVSYLSQYMLSCLHTHTFLAESFQTFSFQMMGSDIKNVCREFYAFCYVFNATAVLLIPHLHISLRWRVSGFTVHNLLFATMHWTRRALVLNFVYVIFIFSLKYYIFILSFALATVWKSLYFMYLS